MNATTQLETVNVNAEKFMDWTISSQAGYQYEKLRCKGVIIMKPEGSTTSRKAYTQAGGNAGQMERFWSKTVNYIRARKSWKHI